MMLNVLTAGAFIGGFELVLAAVLMGLPAFGTAGKHILTALGKAPGLDVLLSVMIWLPWVVCRVTLGWQGVLGAIAGQIVAMQIWVVVHERIHAQATQEPRINGYLNQRFGWWRNHLALWVTSIVLPVFFLIRAAQIFVYPALTLLLGFRRYNHSEWINVSRQKFEGLVGTDLIWCLYCDWMTGVYSLGAEMLRNVESFWCPIRFYYGKKCDNCAIDFPDINGGWVDTQGTMTDVVETLKAQMPTKGAWSWFGDRDRHRS